MKMLMNLKSNTVFRFHLLLLVFIVGVGLAGCKFNMDIRCDCADGTTKATTCNMVSCPTCPPTENQWQACCNSAC